MKAPRLRVGFTGVLTRGQSLQLPLCRVCKEIVNINVNGVWAFTFTFNLYKTSLKKKTSLIFPSTIFTGLGTPMGPGEGAPGL